MSVIRDEAGELLGFTKAARDMTEARRQQAALKAVRDSLALIVTERTAQWQDSVQQLEVFSFSVSHDLRAPLRAMLGFAEALRDDCGDRVGQDGNEYAARIISAAHRLDRLINGILLYSRTARTNLPLQTVDLERVVADALSDNPASSRHRRKSKW